MPNPSSTLSQLPPYLFAEIDRKIDEARARGVDIINLGIGDPDLPTPAPIVEALQAAVADASTHNYPPYQGTKAYREAVSGWMQKRFGVSTDPNQETLALIGSKEGLAHLILAYVDPGDVVLCPSPGYPVYHNYTILRGGQPYTVPLTPANNFLPDLDAIPEAVAQKAKLFFLNYPNNPTGAIIQPQDIEAIVAFCKRYDILLCHDNAYSEMTFDGYRAPSFLSVPGAKEVCIEFFSLSKMYNMTGWRVGFAVGQAEAIKHLGTVKNNTDSGVFKAIQQAAIVGLERSDELTRDLNQIYGRRRDLFVAGLNKLGWQFQPNAATFYLWLPVSAGTTSVSFVSQMLERCGITVPPGTGYGSAGEGYFRVALTVPEARLTEALQRMESQQIRYEGIGAVADACSLA
ncbi:MAG: LL-diaminopimelate aminotransferase [Candidatus Melainabacteria bacterium]|nr:LL-diaminopimelate aminotransferase [Candidatus Melainabacteria bacterium]